MNPSLFDPRPRQAVTSVRDRYPVRFDYIELPLIAAPFPTRSINEIVCCQPMTAPSAYSLPFVVSRWRQVVAAVLLTVAVLAVVLW